MNAARIGARGPAAAGLALVLAISLSLAGCGQHVERDAHAGPAAALPKVTVAEPIVMPISEASEYTGRAEAVETVEVRARASGYLQRAVFHEGDLVKKGDLLFVVDPRPYDAALARARAELKRAQADQELAQREWTRADKLFESKSISERDVDREHSSFVSLAARTQVAAAAVAAAQLDVEYAYVRAPISGRIGRMLVTPGNLVGPTLPTPLATIVSVDRLYVYVDVEESRALALGHDPAKASAAEVAFADETGYPHPATVDFIDNRVDPQTGTLKVRVSVNNDDGALSPGLFARVRLPEGPARDAILVSDRAVATDQDRRFVWVVDKDDKVQHRAVKLGPLHEGMRVVREGLSTSDRVVVRGLTRVRPGIQVSADVIGMKHADASTLGDKGAP